MNRSKQNNSGYALITSLIVTALVTALVLGFINQVTTEQKISRNDTDYASAFYAAEAGLEKLNSDLSKLFQTSVFPTAADIGTIQGTSYRPSIVSAAYPNYSISGGQSTRLSAAMTNSQTTATVTGGTLATWPSTGFFMVDSEEITYTGISGNSFTGLTRGANGSTAATHINNAVVFRSSVLTIAEGPNAGLMAQTIPFSLDVTARAGVGTEARLTREVQVALIPVFQFGVFSDSDLSFFAGPNFSFGGRVHSNGNIFLASGSTLTLSQKVTSAAEIIRSELANGVQTSVAHTGTVAVMQTVGVTRNLAVGEASVTGGPGSTANTSWPTLSLSTYNGNILSRKTGARALVLPFAGGGASPIEIIKRPIGSDDPLLSESRLASQASLRVFISDAVANLPGGTGYPLGAALEAGPYNYAVQDTVGPPAVFRPPFARANPNDPDFFTAADADETAGAELINGFILIQRQNSDGTFADVTMEILNLGIATNQANAILRFQKPRWDAADATNSLNATDYSPINIYDAREGRFRDDFSSVGSNLRKLGIMNLVELNVNNLRLWFNGTIGTTGNLALNNSGYIFYVSDRRGNRDAAGNETGELGFEDFVNPANQNGAPDATLQTGEDLNGNGTLQTYGANLPYSPYSAATDIYTTAITPPVTATVIDINEHVTNSETDLSVSSAADITTPGLYRVDQEIVNCTSKTGNTVTCSRGQLGTTAAAHNAVFVDLMENLTTSDTGINVHDGASLSAPGFYRIDSEIIYCTSVAGNTATCERGRLGTTAATHNMATDYSTEDIGSSETAIDVGTTSFPTAASFYRIMNGVSTELVNCTRSGNTLTCTRGVLGTSGTAFTYVSNSLNGSINSSTTSIPLNNASTITVPGFYRVDNELLNCTSKSSNTLTCSRGYYGSTAASHSNNATFRTQIELRQVNVWRQNLWTSDKASKNRVHYFRRALRLVNGTSPNLPTPGFTVAAENPVYILGNYNSNGTANFADAHSFSAVIADSVTFLSNAWINGGDERSFTIPYTVGDRDGTTTWYRMAIAAGKGVNFSKPANATPPDFGTDGGTHNFLRYLEDWAGATSNYRGSIVSLYYYRQTAGPFKCCASVYTAPTRAYAFDTDFLVPSQLPPGTPRFRDINNLAFRQMIRSDN